MVKLVIKEWGYVTKMEHQITGKWTEMVKGKFCMHFIVKQFRFKETTIRNYWDAENFR